MLHLFRMERRVSADMAAQRGIALNQGLTGWLTDSNSSIASTLHYTNNNNINTAQPSARQGKQIYACSL